MVMDARWKVYVQDRRFDDNQISNVYLKLKYETVGRFSFDFRPVDGDESYMVVNNTLRIFWGDLHKLDGVIQRVEWDSTQWCYHIYGADIRGLLVERVNTEPATVHSYASDIQTQVMFTGCDFPTNVWTGSGENIGRYTFNYRVGIQNTVRIMSPTVRWENVIERGTVYEHQNWCLYDATKDWVPNEYAGATLRFVSGACKNNVYNVNGNTANRVCIRLPGESAEAYGIALPETIIYNGKECSQILTDPSLESQPASLPYITYYQYDPGWYSNNNPDWGDWGDLANWCETSNDPATGDRSVVMHLADHDLYTRGRVMFALWTISKPLSALNIGVNDRGILKFWMKKVGTETIYFSYFDGAVRPVQTAGEYWGDEWSVRLVADYGSPITDEWVHYSVEVYLTGAVNFASATDRIMIEGNFRFRSPESSYGEKFDVKIDDIKLYLPGATLADSLSGKIPGCSRLGDIYEIVTQKMIEVQPPSTTPATLQQDNHIIHYNLTDDQSEHTTSITVRGSG